MRSFGTPTSGSEKDGALQQIIARVQDIKSAAAHGQKRLVIRENGKAHAHAVIDIDMREARDLKEKETYKFTVKEKNINRPGQSQRASGSNFKAYECHDAPEVYDTAAAQAEAFTRFGGSGRTAGSKRIKF